MAESAIHDESENGTETKRDSGQNKFTLGTGDSLDGRLVYAGSISVQGRVEGELRIGGTVDVATGATVKALIDGSSVTVRGDVEGPVTAREKVLLGRSGKINGDVVAKRLQIEDGASINGHVRTGSFEQGG
ncbi:MAG TPA: polymer-forming cytoskeletal protein [Candidatus Dormibacteraeota bacterium]|nr:polymer-forming cytoskeletal protein [Candidatus Dormibacteraeota bacterium]